MKQVPRRSLQLPPRSTGGDHQDALVLRGWIKTIQQDLKSNNLSLNDAADVAQNRPVWRLTSMFGATHS